MGCGWCSWYVWNDDFNMKEKVRIPQRRMPSISTLTRTMVDGGKSGLTVIGGHQDIMLVSDLSIT